MQDTHSAARVDVFADTKQFALRIPSPQRARRRRRAARRDADLERAICSSKPASPPEEHRFRGFPAPRFPLRLLLELPGVCTHPERSLQDSGEEVGALVRPLHALVLGAVCVWQGAGRGPTGVGLVSGDLSAVYLRLLPRILVLGRIATLAEPPVCSDGPGGHQGVRAAGGGGCLAARSTPGTTASGYVP